MTLLLVDDDPFFRESLAEDLRSSGAVVIEADGVIEAREKLRRAERIGEPFQLVVSDVDMGDGTGFDLFDAVQLELSQAPPFVFASAWVSDWKSEAAQKRASKIFDKNNKRSLLECILKGDV
jgi:CheY-like chemotaxis protein